MKELKSAVVILVMLSIVLCWNLIKNFEEIDDYNKLANSHSWESRLGSDIESVTFLGNDEEYCIRTYGSKGSGIIDKNGNEILPCKFFAAEYKNGKYMAAATKDKWILMNLDGDEINSFNRISCVYSYAGDKYFIKYGDDAYISADDGFAIVDGISGDVVKEYNSYYNAVRLDDGNWYICKTMDDDGIMARMILTERGTYSSEFSDESTFTPGFFTNEKFEPLFGGKEYQLICQKDGLYVAKNLKEDVYVVIDENGVLFEVEDRELANRIERYEANGNLSNNETITVFREDDGNIGFASIDNIYDVIYYDNEGELKGNSQIASNKFKVSGEEWVVFTETEEGEYFTYTKYGIKDKNDEVLLPATFYDLRKLPETENIMVNSDMGCGIIRLEVN